jgi:hypothetical protein
VTDPQPVTRQVVEKLLAGIAAGPSPDLADCYAEDAVVEMPFAQLGGLVLRGRGEGDSAAFRQGGTGVLPLDAGRCDAASHHGSGGDCCRVDYEGQVLPTGSASG